MTSQLALRNLPTLPGWVLTGLMGAATITVLAPSRGESVNALRMVIAAACVFAVAYRFHAAWLTVRVLKLDDLRATPAHIHEDGKDYVPTKRWIVALLSLAWLLIATVTAGWMKIFSADPRLGFLSAAANFQTKLSSGSTPAQIDAWQHQIFNNQVNVVVTGTFRGLVITIVTACGREWWELLAARNARPLRKEPYVALPAA